MMVNISQLSEMTGFDRATISKRLAHLEFEPGNKRAKFYKCPDALAILYKFGIDDTERLDPQQEKARLDRERRLIAELDRQQKERKLIDADEVKDDWMSVVSVTRSRFLALPSRIVPELANLKDMRKMEDALIAAIHEVLEEMAANG